MDRYAMVVRSDARAMGAITALGAPQRTKPRTTARALTDCVVYANQDDYDAGIASHVIHRTTPSDRTLSKRRASRSTPVQPHRIMAADLAPIGNVE